jgi:hypothetical protein
MRPVAIMWLCLVAAFALGAIAAPTAQAAPPEYGQCRELTANTTPKAKHGRFTDANCQTLYESNGKLQEKGSYAWYPGPAANCIADKKGEYTDSACTDKAAKAHKGTFERQACWPNCEKYKWGDVDQKLTFTFYTSLPHPVVTVVCDGAPGTGHGEISGPKEGKVYNVTFNGCEQFPNDKECQGLDQPPGEIETVPLDTELREESTGTVYTQYRPSSGHVYADLYCQGLGYFEVRGSTESVGGAPLDQMFPESSMDGLSYPGFSELARYFETKAEFEKQETTSEPSVAEEGPSYDEYTTSEEINNRF